MDRGSCLSRNVSFINTDLEQPSSNEWRHLSGLRTLRLVQWYLNPLYNGSLYFVHTTGRTQVIFYCYKSLEISKYEHLFIR